MLGILALSSLAGFSAAADARFDFRRDAKQMVLVAAESVEGLRAKVSLWEKASDGWHRHSENIPAVVGRHGLGLGKGLHEPDFLGLRLPPKKEGDLKAPAGVFLFGDIYGYAPKPSKILKLNYVQVFDSFEGVDDP